MIANERPVIADSLWSATANPTPDCPKLQGDINADVAIVGGGYTGLSAALHLAEAGVRAVVLEAETPGWGASGRNGGQVNPGLKEGPDQLEANFGAEMGARMARMSGTAGDLVFDLIERHGISCDANRSGWLRAAHDRKTLDELTSLGRQWQRRGREIRMTDAHETQHLIGTDVYIGGLIDVSGGNLHPLNYALGLAEAGIRAGAQICGHSRVTGLERIEGGHRLRTAEGSVEAAQVLLCTNGYTDGLVPPLQRTVIPVRSCQVATVPLSDNIAHSILPERHSPSDLRRLLLYFRKDAQNRFIMGARGAYSDAATLRSLEAARRIAVDLYPQLDGVEWAHAWGGYVAITTDHFPHLHQLAPGLMAALGYNGRGVAMATAMGKLLAEWAQGKPEAELDFPVTSARPVPFHRFHRVGTTAKVMQYKALDALGF
ncbi:MAG: NAD(P)/FAD-dependent oxidoreductase [Paracoccaceae bacterium]